jgi:outer membrane protein assembly factor BamB
VITRTPVAPGSAPLRRFASKPEGKDDRALALSHGALRCYDLSGHLLWKTHPPGLNFEAITSIEDLDNDGRVEIALTAGRPGSPLGAALLLNAATGKLLWRYDVEPMSYAWYYHIGNYLPRAIGKQLVVLMHAYPPDKLNGYIALFEFPAPGKPPVQRWRYDFDHYTCFPTLLQSDLDGDGVKELCVETHSRMWLLDALTGAVKQFIMWDVSPGNNRSYGLVQFTDLNGDGREDFLCIATFAQHHEVLLNKNGKLELAWVHGWDNSVTTSKIVSAWSEPPVADVDGDGRLEVIVSMFNSENDARWMIRIYDALTGEIKARVPDCVAFRAADVDGDGKAEILAEITADPTRERVDGAALIKIASGMPQYMWREDGARVAVALPSRGKKQRGLRLERRFLISRAGKTYALSVKSGQVVLDDYTAPPEPPRADVSRISAPSGDIVPPPLVKDLDSDGKPEIIHSWQGKVTIYHWDRKRGLKPIREFPASGDPALADLDGDGKTELVVGEAAPAHEPVVRALRPDGSLLWESRLPKTDRRGLPHGRAVYFQVGRFTGRPTPDIYALFGTPIVRSVVLDGLTGKLVWEKGEFPGIERYYGPTVNLASVYDVDADGAEDLVFTNPDYYCVASGKTGELIVGPAFPPKIFNQPSQGLYTLPAILEPSVAQPLLAVTNQTLVVLCDGHYFLGAIGLRAEPRWYQLPEVGAARSGAEGLLRLPDGSWLIGFGRQNGNFACLDAATGKVLWEFPIEAAAGDVVACDINGDGADEFIFGDSHGRLWAISPCRAGVPMPALVWKLNLDLAIGSPVIADLDGDASPEIILPTSDGSLTILSPAP